MHYSLRPLCADDESFLWQMLYYAAQVDREEGRTIADMQRDPVMPNYVTGWGRPGDLGFVAVDDGGAALGAAWLRLPTANGGGYSTAEPNVPELAIALLPSYVGQGIGTRLLQALLTAARGHYPAVILNVRQENPARRLYTRLGFAPIREITNRVGGRSIEMLYTFETETPAITDPLSEIRQIEEASLNAWPAHQSMVDQGWLLRFAAGYTRRSNSVNPIYQTEADSAAELAARITRCESIYRARQLPIVFKMTPLVQPPHLDAVLADRGYVHDAPTTIRRRHLAAPLPASDTDGVVQIEEVVSQKWLDAFVRFSELNPEQIHALRGILHNIVPTTAYAGLMVDDEVVACALAVMEDVLVGLYDVVTAPSARGRGYGTHLLITLLNWAKARGAEKAYLAVMDNNLPAKRLYDKLGFTELYPYWYRVQRT